MTKILALSSIALLLGACAQVPSAGVPPQVPAALPSAASPALSTDTLAAYEWQLAAAQTADGQAIADLAPGLERRLRVRFDAQSLHVQGGCNALFGAYAVAPGSLQLRGLASTMKACPAPLMQLDQAVSARLKDKVAARVQGSAPNPVLVLTTADGDVLQWIGEPISR